MLNYFVDRYLNLYCYEIQRDFIVVWHYNTFHFNGRFTRIV